MNEGDGMSRFVLARGEWLRIEIVGSDAFRARAPEVFQALVDWTKYVNDRYVESGSQSRLELEFL
jgi:hypothetical protein